MNWASGEFLARLDGLIMSEGYQCDVEYLTAGTMPQITSMTEKGTPDIASELWANAAAVAINSAVEEKRLTKLNPKPITGAGEGWMMSAAAAKAHPELKTIDDIIARPDLFPHPEDPSMGGLHTCPSGWGCQLANANLFRAFEMEKKGWVLVDPGSAAGLDGSMAKAVERGENWFGYYWSPTSMIGKYNMVPVPFGVPFAGSDNWDGCIVKPEQECADPKPSAWTHSEVNTVITDRFKRAGGPAVDYLNNRVYPGAVMNGMLVYMADNQAGGADAAIEFLQKHEDVWTKWVSSSVAAKVKASL
jgi:glycine betaine/proline transport system substrate-binding protein